MAPARRRENKRVTLGAAQSIYEDLGTFAPIFAHLLEGFGPGVYSSTHMIETNIPRNGWLPNICAGRLEIRSCPKSSFTSGKNKQPGTEGLHQSFCTERRTNGFRTCVRRKTVRSCVLPPFPPAELFEKDALTQSITQFDRPQSNAPVETGLQSPQYARGHFAE